MNKNLFKILINLNSFKTDWVHQSYSFLFRLFFIYQFKIQQKSFLMNLFNN